MHGLSSRRTPRLLGVFVVATLLPAAALTWLGLQLIEQDRSLGRQRVQDLVESTANSVTAAIERELGELERSSGSPALSPPQVSAADPAVTGGFAIHPGGRSIAFTGAAGKQGPEVWALENVLPSPAAR